MEFKHVSVLLNECIEGLAVKPDGRFLRFENEGNSQQP